MSKFTRRELAAALPHRQSCLPGLKANRRRLRAPHAADELQASLSQLRDNAAQLDKFPLPMATEPATTFKP